MTKKEAVRIVEGTIGDHPEIKVIQRKEAALEVKGSAKYGSIDGHHYCPECSTWTPEEPPAIKAFGKEWKKVFDREVEKIWKTKSATQ